MEDGGPSVTARRVAAHRLGFDRAAADYGDPAADQALAADVAAGYVAPANRMHDYLAARTAFFDRTVVAGIDRGVRQVVVGAAGYDARAFRYAKPGVRWFEVDHPATQRDKLARLERLGLDASHVRFVEADFTRDPVADRLRAAGLRRDVVSLFLLEGIAVYLEPAVLEAVLGQFREVAAPGSRLAISVSMSRAHDDAARARFQAAVAALGEPARSAFEADEAEALLARTGWQITARRDETAARRQRLRSAGLLTARAGPRAADSAGALPADSAGALPADSGGALPADIAGPTQPNGPIIPRHAGQPRPSRPSSLILPKPRCPCRPCCPRRWSPPPSSSTTRPNTPSRTAPPATGPPALPMATRGPGWCRWSCGRTACGMSPPSRSRSQTSWPARAPGPTWTACAAGATSRSRPIQGNWRARLPRPAVLPCYPMVLHRGGYPDGS